MTLDPKHIANAMDAILGAKPQHKGDDFIEVEDAVYLCGSRAPETCYAWFDYECEGFQTWGVIRLVEVDIKGRTITLAPDELTDEATDIIKDAIADYIECQG